LYTENLSARAVRLRRRRLLPRSSARHPLKLPGIFLRHARLVARAFAAFPEAVAFFADEACVADAAVFGAVVLFAGT
jgi:hypothetical protein